VRAFEAGKAWEIRVRTHAGGAWLSRYVGPWTDKAEDAYVTAQQHHACRVRRHVSDREVMAMFYGHPDMPAIEDTLYAVRYENPPEGAPA
jgi:hypothetical protein